MKLGTYIFSSHIRNTHAVSYTHLLIIRVVAIRHSGKKSLKQLQSLVHISPHNVTRQITHHTVPVSYTHLDVYKRQAEPAGFVSAAIHSSVSGKVAKIDTIVDALSLIHI